MKSAGIWLCLAQQKSNVFARVGPAGILGFSNISFEELVVAVSWKISEI